MKWKTTLLLATALYTFLGLPVTVGLAAGRAAEDEVPLPDLAETPAAGSPGSSGQAPVSSAGSLDQAPASSLRSSGQAPEGSPGSSDHAAASATLLEEGVKSGETLTRPDPVPPKIEYTPYRGKLPSGIGIEIWSRIRDNTSVARAELFFRNKGDLGFQSLPLQNEGNDIYTVTVPADSITGSAVEYYLMAQDAAGNLSYAGTVESPYRVAVAGGPELKPWYKKWWVWGIVALAAGAGAGAGIAMGGGGGNGSQETTNVTVVISPP